MDAIPRFKKEFFESRFGKLNGGQPRGPIGTGILCVEEAGRLEGLDLVSAVAGEKQQGVVGVENAAALCVDNQYGLVLSVGQDAEELAKGIPAKPTRERNGTSRRLRQ